jgi:hypothetical protein
MCTVQGKCIRVVLFRFAALGLALASITGSISGLVTDPWGAIIAGLRLSPPPLKQESRPPSPPTPRAAIVLPPCLWAPRGLRPARPDFRVFRPESLVGLVSGARDARIMQVAMKFVF